METTQLSGIKHPDCLFIGGAWVKPKAEGRIDIVSPSTEQVVASVAEGREADMDRAVAAARLAFDAGPWPLLSHAERAAYVTALAARLRLRNPDLAAAWIEQVGSLAGAANFLSLRGAAELESYAGYASTYPFETRQPSAPKGTAIIVREPVGVVAAIAPWNAPYLIMIAKVAPALLAGCTIIMKPSPETPLEAYIIAECAEEAGLPPGVINLVTAHREASDYLVRQPGVDMISFTGSTGAGRRIATVAAERIARVSLELGGKSAAIVLDDYPLADAARALTRGITMMSGQICATLSRVIISRHRHDEFADALSAELDAVTVGDPHEAATQMGPLSMQRQLARVEGYIAKGRDEGARLVTGGGRPTHMNQGFYIEPTLFANVDNRMTIAQEEIFGPVLSLIPADDTDDAIRIANESIFGLNGAVFSHDPERIYAVARRMRTGGVGQNGFRMDHNAPFGGFKQSGIGREHGPEGLVPYLETKTILVD